MAIEYWDTNRVLIELGVNGVDMKRNNLAQIVHRMRKGHELAGHSNNGKCVCLLVDHKGNGVNWYRADKVIGFRLYRRGAPSLHGEIIRNARKANNVQRAGRKTIGRPTTRVTRN